MTALSRAVNELIKPAEACKLTAYLCPAGKWTVGWGTTGPDVVQGTVWTQEQADNRLLLDAAKAERAVKRMVKVPLSEGQAAALISLVYNIGGANFESSTLLRKLNADDFDAAAVQFDRWIFAKGRKLNGLVKRRAAERKVFEGG